jgi:hypothetical protein
MSEEPGMQNGQQDRRINGAALELIMQDVLRGMQEFTRDACCGCDAAGLEILGVEDAGSASLRQAEVLQFPANQKITRPD